MKPRLRWNGESWMPTGPEWRKQRKIAQLPGTRRTPINSLASTLEKAMAGHIKSVYIGIQWADDTFCGEWCAQPRKDLVAHALVAQQNALNEFTQGGDYI